MPLNILITGETWHAEILRSLQADGHQIEHRTECLEEEALGRALQGKDAYILGGVEFASGTVLRQAKNLKIIAVLGVGCERFVDVKTATTQGIAVTNTPNVNSRAVAEMTIGMILAMRRKIPFLNQLTKTGRWRNDVSARSLAGTRLGIIGMGAIGGMVADIAYNGFGMKTLYTDVFPKPHVEKRIGAIRVKLNELLSASDVVSLHCPLTEQTRNILGKQQFQVMKPDAILINTARPHIVDPYALCAALKDGVIAGCAMDGYYIEPAPSPEDDPYELLKLSDELFLVTSHLAYLTEDSIRQMCDLAVRSVIVLSQGEEWDYIVNLEYKNYCN